MKKWCVSMALVVVSLGVVGTPAYAASPAPGSVTRSGPGAGAAPQLLCWIWPKHCL